MNIKNIAKSVTKYIVSAGAYAVTSTIIEKTMPKPDSVLETIEYRSGQVGLSLGAAYLAGEAVDAKFDETYEAVEELITTVKTMKNDEDN